MEHRDELISVREKARHRGMVARTYGAVRSQALVGAAVATLISTFVLGWGVRDAAAAPALYLPYAGGTAHRVSQGNSGPLSHFGTYGTYAVDFDMTVNTAVVASAAGTVVTARGGCDGLVRNDGCNSGLGNYLVVQHEPGFCTQYAHLNTFVRTSGSVARGETIGRSGNSGYSTNPHLDFRRTSCDTISQPFKFVEYSGGYGHSSISGMTLVSQNAGVAGVAAHRNRLVHWNGDAGSQKATWYVSGHLKRYWVPDGGTYNCLRGQGVGGPDPVPSTSLDQLSDQSGQGVTCGGDWLGVNRILFRNTYVRSNDGRFTLILQSDGNLVLYGPSGVIWANHRNSDMLILQPDGNLVTYSFSGGATWSSGTSGSGSSRLVVQNDGNLVLYSPTRATWTYRGVVPAGPTPSTYRNRLVQWNGDTKAQRTSWLVSGQLKRYWVPDGGTYNCLRGQGYGGPDVLGSSMLDQLADQSGQGVTCGGDWLGVNRILFRNTYVRSNDGRFTLILQSDGNLVLYGPSGVIWANHRNSDMLILQPDGNLVTYSFSGGATWSSGTSGSGSSRLVVQNDGNLVLYSPTRATWTYRGRL